MTDRELLELAAKAAGIEYEWKREGYIGGATGVVPKDWRRCWNPLTDDGDALRLAVTLGIEFASFNGSKVSRSRVLDMTGSDIFEPHEIDPYSATRRAIVRAAAEIGKDMK